MDNIRHVISKYSKIYFIFDIETFKKNISCASAQFYTHDTKVEFLPQLSLKMHVTREQIHQQNYVV